MKLRCERDVLADALTTTARAVAGRGSGLASGVQLRLQSDRLHVLGRDPELTIETFVEVQGLGDGSCNVPGRLTMDIVRSLEPGVVILEADDDDVRLGGGRSQFSVRAIPSADPFPARSAEGEAIVLDAVTLGEALGQVVRAASSDSERPSLTGVLLTAEQDGIRLVATDLYRLALRDLHGTRVLAEDQRVLLPARGLSELRRLLEHGGDDGVSVRIGELEAAFELGAVRLTTRLLRAEFPNYTSLIPSGYPNRLVVAKIALLDALRRVRLMVRDSASSVRMTMQEDRVELAAQAAEVGQAAEDIDGSYEGAELMLAFNPAFLVEGVEAVTSEDVVIESRDASKPALIRGIDSDEYRYLLMPVRVS